MQIECCIEQGEIVPTQGNFLVTTESGNRVAAFAVEDDAKVFLSISSILRAWHDEVLGKESLECQLANLRIAVELNGEVIP